MKTKHSYPCWYLLLLVYCCYTFTACRKVPAPPPSMLAKKITAYEPGTSLLRYEREYIYNASGKAVSIVQTDYTDHGPGVYTYKLSYNSSQQLDTIKVSYPSGYQASIAYSYNAAGLLSNFMSGSFLPSYIMFVRYNESWPTPDSPPAQLTVSDQMSKLKRTAYYIGADNNVYRIVKGLYHIITDTTTYLFTYGATVNPEFATLRETLFFDYPSGGSWLNREAELSSPKLPVSMTERRYTDSTTLYAYEHDCYQRVTKVFIVNNGAKQLFKRYEY